MKLTAARLTEAFQAGNQSEQAGLGVLGRDVSIVLDLVDDLADGDDGGANLDLKESGQARYRLANRQLDLADQRVGAGDGVVDDGLDQIAEIPVNHQIPLQKNWTTTYLPKQ